jgi:hypothetical protein
MTNGLPTFQIRVRPAPEINGHEVCLLADNIDLVEFFAAGQMGLDPTELLIEPCALRADRSCHAALVARCRCGYAGCSSGEVKIQANDRRVTWAALDSARSIEFDSLQYSIEVERALNDCSWETPERTAARLIMQAVDRRRLADRGFQLCWASGRCSEGLMTVSLLLSPGPYQVLVRLEWDGENIDAVVGQFKAILHQSPETWPSVECNPQKEGLGDPPITGPGWK